jgi:endonuclease/exonuclease/phosphatase family metal-dependent hydrolase
MKIVTYNIQYSRGKDDRFNLGRIAEAVDGADVIGLNEVERFWPRNGEAVNQPAELGALLPDYYWVYGPYFDMDASERTTDGTVINGRRQHGSMLLSRSPILKHVVMVSGPGITTSDYSLFPWKQVRRPIYPLDVDTEAELPRRRL